MSGVTTGAVSAEHAGMAQTHNRVTKTQGKNFFVGQVMAWKDGRAVVSTSPPYCWSRRSAEREAEQLDDGTPSACGQMHDQQDDADDEENPRDLRSDCRNASRSENARDQSND